MKRNIHYTHITILTAFFFSMCVGVYPLKADNDGIKTVVIDPGHGGKAPGCTAPGIMEKDIVLSVGLKLGALIEKNCPDVKVIYTRKTDISVELIERAAIANRNHADLFISIHVNSVPAKTSAADRKRIKGAETFTMGIGKSDANMQVAQRENSAILLEDNYSSKYEGFDPNSPESYIIFNLMQNAYINQSIEVAELIQKHIKTSTPMADRGVKQDGFLVLYKTAMPSVLVELGFLSNPDDTNIMKSAGGQDKLAAAIFNAFRAYKNKVEQKSNFTVSTSGSSNTNAATQNTAPKTNTAAAATATTSTANTNTNTGKSTGKNEIYFYVQISAIKITQSPDVKKFKGLNDLEVIKTATHYKYMVGKSTSINKARERLKEVSSKFPDAFITATKNGESLSASQAIKEL